MEKADPEGSTLVAVGKNAVSSLTSSLQLALKLVHVVRDCSVRPSSIIGTVSYLYSRSQARSDLNTHEVMLSAAVNALLRPSST